MLLAADVAVWLATVQRQETTTLGASIRPKYAFSRSFEFAGAPFILASLLLLSAAVIAWRGRKVEGRR